MDASARKFVAREKDGLVKPREGKRAREEAANLCGFLQTFLLRRRRRCAPRTVAEKNGLSKSIEAMGGAYIHYTT